MAKTTKAAKYVYFFGGGKADGNESMKNLLGGKGANLAEMAGHPKLRLPVPPGFTVTTEVCTYFYANKRTYPKILKAQVQESLAKMEKITGKKFGDVKNPLLLSVRSGARKSMPGMMETVLNVGLNEETIKGVIAQSGDERFAYDAYRRLIMMYADVVMEKAAGVEPKGKGIRKLLDEKLEQIKHDKKYASDTDLTVDELKALVFLIFDVELVFLYPWAVVAKKVGWLAFGEIVVFFFILFIGFVYAHKKGALKWI